MPEIARALLLFALADLAEIRGGWLVWQWLREARPWPLGLVGAAVLIGYGVIVICARPAAISAAGGSVKKRWNPVTQAGTG